MSHMKRSEGDKLLVEAESVDRTIHCFEFCRRVLG